MRQRLQAPDEAVQCAERFSNRVTELQDEWVRRAEPLRSDATARTIIRSLPSFPLITTRVIREPSGRSDVAAINGLTHL